LLLLETMKPHERHSFLSDDKLRRKLWKTTLERCHGHQQVNDALLVALAQSHDAHVVTFDQHLNALATQSAVVEVLA
jgi:predicted nucleic acid-binding protein